MKYIYVENYLKISREMKLEFLKFMYCFKRFKIINQKIVLNDNSLILELSVDSSFNIAKKSIDLFFKKNKDIKSFFTDRLLIEKNTLYLFNDNNLIKEVKLK
ncbi:MAG: hypothetical protein C0625_05345 [Arcobacter sp.]|nr:MAG: hypothetical protein C0625_05345 [Arcobacter sp.]